MKFETKIFEEPQLEFGDKHHHPDPRLGLFEAGPLQIPPGDVVKVAVVGSSKTVEDAKGFFAEAAAGFAGHGEKHPNLHPDFPGFGNQNPFRCRFEMADDEIIQQLETLDEGSYRPNVAIVALPVSLIERVWNAKVDSKATTEKDDSGGSDAPDFRGMLKAKAMGLSFAIQIVWEDVFDENATIPRKVKENRARKIQDEADRTWNLLTTLYYKGTGRIPWRKMPLDGEFTACYIGVSFYREVGGQQLFTSAAQMFDERGRGFILKGKRAHTESRGRHPYMTQEDAKQLITDALAAYKNHHRNYPARVIVLKTSQFREEEADGTLEAIDEAGAEL